ncbi:hypothetical protein TWF506_009221 [Arthrobotrys conoides]|uniref:Peptide hydrolase n=1 Tax=Arthrobotrys conoides TaxID=74498 RepID=A0AAN8RR66_9PEZI
MRSILSSATIWVLCASVVSAGPLPTSAQFEASINKASLLIDLAKFNLIATLNGGNRAPNSPGFEASVDWIRSRVQNSAKFSYATENYQTKADLVDSKSLKINGKNISPIEAGVILGGGPNPPQRIQGDVVRIETGGPDFCNNPNWVPNVNVNGKILLYRLANCYSGAVGGTFTQIPYTGTPAALLFYRDNWRPDNVVKRDLPSPEDLSKLSKIKRQNGDSTLWAIISKQEALKVHNRLNSNLPVTADLKVVNYRYDDVTRKNVIVETTAGSQSNVLVLGARLDSAPFNAGINDNASGVSLLLALIDAIKAGKFIPKNKIRFIFWGTGGSAAYTAGLSPTEAARIRLYLDFQSVSRGAFGVYDGDGSRYSDPGPTGSNTIENTFTNYFTSKGITAKPARLQGDVFSFMSGNVAKPVGGLFGGDAVVQDPCYGQPWPCDNLPNAHLTHLETNAKAAAHALYALDQSI